MGVFSSERTPIVFVGKRTCAGVITALSTEVFFFEWGDPDTRMSCTVFHTAPELQARTITGKRTALPTRVRTSTHRLQVDSELGPAKTSLRVGLSKCDFPYPARSPSVLSATG
jgi:hypothetical protein